MSTQEWKGNDNYQGESCFGFNYSAKNVGTTEVTLHVEYEYYYSGIVSCGFHMHNISKSGTYYDTITFTVNVVDGTIPKDPDISVTHELYLPVGGTFDEFQFGFAYEDSSVTSDNFQFISNNSNIATFEKTSSDSYSANSRITGIAEGDTSVSVTYESTYNYAPIVCQEIINVHVYDPYELTLNQGETEPFEHEITQDYKPVYNLEIITEPQITSGNDKITISKEGTNWIDDNSMIINITGNQPGSATVETCFGFSQTQISSGSAGKFELTSLSYFVDKINVTVTDAGSTVPPAPGSDDLKNLFGENVVTIECINDTLYPSHTSETYGLLENGYSTDNSVKGNATDGYTYDITIHPNAYVTEYNKSHGAHVLQTTNPVQGDYTITLTWDKNSNAWKLPDPSNLPVTYSVECTGLPSYEDLKKLLGDEVVTIECINDTLYPSHTSETYGLLEGGYSTDNSVNGNATNGYTYDITIHPNAYVTKYSESYGIHALQATDPAQGDHTITLVLDKNSNTWTLPTPSNLPVTYSVECTGLPSYDDLKDLLGDEVVTLTCDVHNSKTYPLLENSYSLERTTDKTDNHLTIHVSPTLYLTEYNKTTNITHSCDAVSDEIYLIKDQNGKWILDTTNGADGKAEFKVVCPPALPDKEDIDDLGNLITLHCISDGTHADISYPLDKDNITISYTSGQDSAYYADVATTSLSPYLTSYNTSISGHRYVADYGTLHFTLKYNEVSDQWENQSAAVTLNVEHTGGIIPDPDPDPDPDPTPDTRPSGDDDDDSNTVTRVIRDDDTPLNNRPNNTMTIEDEDVPMADLPDDTVTIDDDETPLKANPSTGDSFPFAAMVAAALSLGGVIFLNRKKK